MKARRLRFVSIVFVGLAVGAGGLLASAPASADKALFRVERSFFLPEYTFENPLEPFRTTTPGQATRTTTTDGGAKNYFRGLLSTAVVTPLNAAGAPFTLPRSFIMYHYTVTSPISSVSFATMLYYVNGEGRFRPNNPYGVTGTATKTIVFPTTGGNPVPNFGGGPPVTATTPFGGDLDFLRAGSIMVDPGPNHFGGTLRLLSQRSFPPEWRFQQYWFSRYRVYGTGQCTHMKLDCTELLESTPGQQTASTTWFILPVNKYVTSTNTVTPTRFGRTMYHPLVYPGSVSTVYFLHSIAPWTTGKVWLSQPIRYGTMLTLSGYDKAFTAPMDLTVTRTNGSMTTKQLVKGVTRVVSMVRPRLIHAYLRDSSGNIGLLPNLSPASLWKVNVFFLPEPRAPLLLGSAVTVLAGLFLLRRHGSRALPPRTQRGE